MKPPNFPMLVGAPARRRCHNRAVRRVPAECSSLVHGHLYQTVSLEPVTLNHIHANKYNQMVTHISTVETLRLTNGLTFQTPS